MVILVHLLRNVRKTLLFIYCFVKYCLFLFSVFAANLLFVFPLAFGFFRLCGRVLGNRVSAEVEWSGLDSLEMGSDAYPPG